MSAFRLIAAEKANHPVDLMCRVLGVSRSGFYAWSTRAPSNRALHDAWLIEQIGEIHAANRGVYGSPRIQAELRMARGIHVGRKRVERLMRKAGISGLVPKKHGRTTIRVPGVRVADDLVKRDFQPAGRRRRRSGCLVAAQRRFRLWSVHHLPSAVSMPRFASTGNGANRFRMGRAHSKTLIRTLAVPAASKPWASSLQG